MNRIVIDVDGRQLHLYRDGVLDRTFTVAVGKPATPTPAGTFTIVEKTLHPGDVFGTRWLGLSRRHYGIHGTNAPHLIGQAVSNGCVRMHNSDVEYVYEQVETGTEVEILKGPAYEAKTGTHIVQPGESLWIIAGHYGITVESMIAANHLSSPYIIYPGQKLLIPGTDAGEPA